MWLEVVRGIMSSCLNLTYLLDTKLRYQKQLDKKFLS
jgi:hypothetical protein